MPRWLLLLTIAGRIVGALIVALNFSPCRWATRSRARAGVMMIQPTASGTTVGRKQTRATTSIRRTKRASNVTQSPPQIQPRLQWQSPPRVERTDILTMGNDFSEQTGCFKSKRKLISTIYQCNSCYDYNRVHSWK